MSDMLTAIKDDQWKHARSTISPTFTTGKLRKVSMGGTGVFEMWRGGPAVNVLSTKTSNVPVKMFEDLQIIQNHAI